MPSLHGCGLTENGPEVYDEINLVGRGLQQRLAQDYGSRLAQRGCTKENGNRAHNASDLVYLPNAYYADPIFSWLQPIGVTSIVFVRSARFDAGVRDEVIVGETNNGRLYRFTMNAARDDFVLTDALADRVADSVAERNLSSFGTRTGAW
jgi:hypothetical protein